MKYKAIIFDMDGTIVDTEHVWIGATKKLISSKGLQVNPEQEAEIQKRLFGLTCKATCKLIKELGNLPDSVEQLVEELVKYAKELYQTGVQFIPGFVEFHQTTKTHNLRTGIATNADDHTLYMARTQLNLDAFFGSHIYNPSVVNNVGKPQPDLYLHVAQQLQIPAQECIAIEDSAHGIAAAQAAGMLCIGIGTSPDPDQIKSADIAVQGYQEIMSGLPQWLFNSTTETM